MSKIKRNTVTNLKAIEHFEANLNGATAIITGKNNGGKSSFLRSIIDRLQGMAKDKSIKPDVILRTGTSEGMQEIELTTGERFLWSFDNKTAKGERLIFVTKDHSGAEIKTSVTKEIATRFFPPSFDIDTFLLSQPKKQKEALEKVSGLDFTEINEQYKVAYDERTFSNKKLADAKAALRPILNSLPTEQTDTVAIMLEIGGIEKHNKAYDTAKAGADQLQSDKTATETEIKRLEQLLKTARERDVSIGERIVKAKEWLDTAENKPKDEAVVGVLRKKLEDAREMNKLIETNNEAIKAKADVLALDISTKEKDAAVKEIELKKVEMIKNSNLPEGFDFTDDGILFNGLPVTREQLSTSSIYIAALKLAAMTLGEVKTLYFDASMLDKNSLAQIEQWAIAEGEKLFGEPIQLLLERVDVDAGDLRYELLEEVK